MALPDQTSHFVSRLQKTEKTAILTLDAAFPNSNLLSTLLSAVEDVCFDRLVRAEGCLHVARQLALSTEKEALRTAVGRAYYSVHHSLRAMTLWKNKWDPDGHEESIQQFKALLNDKAFRDTSSLVAADYKRVSQARTNRHVADYSPYDSLRELKSDINDGTKDNIVIITENDWKKAADFNIDIANDVLNAALRTIAS